MSNVGEFRSEESPYPKKKKNKKERMEGVILHPHYQGHLSIMSTSFRPQGSRCGEVQL